MSLLKSLSAAERFEPSVSKASAGVPAQGFLPALGGTPSAAGVAVSQATAVTVSGVYACVKIRSADVAMCRPRLVRGEGRRTDIVTEHPVAKLLRRPNWMQTWFEFAEQMEIGLLLRGNAYAAILRGSNGQPTALIPINPDAVMVLEAADGSVFYNVNRIGLFQIAALRGFDVAIPAEDIFHLRGMSFNMLVGVSTIGIARDSIGVAMGLEQQAARWMSNGARPSGVLKMPKTLSKEAAQRLRDQWAAFTSGLQNAGRTAILEEGLEWQSIQLSAADVAFIEQRNFQIAEIARYYRMPLHKLNVPAQGAQADIAKAEQAYVNGPVMESLRRWEDKFDFVFNLNEEGLRVDFDERSLLRADEATRINNHRLAVMSGLKTQNECRAEEGDPPMEGGDILLTPVNLAASGSDMTGTAPDGAGRPAAGKLPDPGAPNKIPEKRQSAVVTGASALPMDGAGE